MRVKKGEILKIGVTETRARTAGAVTLTYNEALRNI